MGTIFALDIPDETNGYLSEIGPALYEYCLEQDVLLRPIGNTVYIMPPYCSLQRDLDLAYDVLWRALDKLRANKPRASEKVA